MKRVVILYSECSPVIDAIKYQLQKSEVVCIKEPDSTIKDCDLVVLVNFNSEFSGNALKCHHSLLPAFDTDEPVKDAILAGVKVTGITIYETDTKKIITQYPIFIKEDMHYDELKQELDYLEQTIYPLVTEKVLNKELFNIKELMNGSCSGNCGGCAGCRS
jgi:hypothetical protein